MHLLFHHFEIVGDELHCGNRVYSKITSPEELISLPTDGWEILTGACTVLARAD